MLLHQGTAIDRAAREYWEVLAGKWRNFPPLAPCGDDIAWYEDQARTLAGPPGVPLRALLLGVTPAIAAMLWPAGTRLLATDWAGGMFRHVWPKQGLPDQAARVCADWRRLPLAAGSIDFTVGDGCYSALGNPEDISRLNAEAHRVLRPGGLLCLRCFCRPEKPLAPEVLFDELLSGRLRNLSLFRWLLAMALQGSSPDGVTLEAVWAEWKTRIPDPRALQKRFGWSAEAIANIERGSSARMRYNFPTLDELRRLAAPLFELLESNIPGYEWGERFPRIVLRARG